MSTTHTIDAVNTGNTTNLAPSSGRSPRMMEVGQTSPGSAPSFESLVHVDPRDARPMDEASMEEPIGEECAVVDDDATDLELEEASEEESVGTIDDQGDYTLPVRAVTLTASHCRCELS